jgi:hypothetical protein
MALVRFKSAVDYVAGHLKAFGDNSAYIQAVTLVDSTGAAPTAGTADQVQGNVASAATDSGNPVKVGGVYRSAPGVLTDGQRADVLTDNRGALLVTFNVSGAQGSTLSGAAADARSNTITAPFVLNYPYYKNASATWDSVRGDANGAAVQPALSANFWSYAGVTGGILDTADVALKAAAGASVRNYISSLQFKNTAAVASEIVIKDGSTVIWRGHVSASMTFAENIPFNPPLKGTANTALNVAMLTTATATIVSAQGYTGV